MLKISEYAYNACERNGTLESEALFEKRLEMLEHTHFLNRNEVYRWVYLGFEFCENMMLQCKIENIEKKIELVIKKGYKVAFVFPMMHQKRIPLFKEWIGRLVKQNLVSEWIVNDFGTLRLLKEAGICDGIVFGRMFEKSIRETRQNILEIAEIEKHFEIFQPGESFKGIWKIWRENYGIHAAEVDTFPDGIVDLTQSEIECHVHYPDIYLSCSPYCEYANCDMEEKGRFILHQSCGAECCLYEQRITTANGRDFYKIGNVMLCRQTKKPEECIEGCFRLVYSDRIHLQQK